MKTFTCLLFLAFTFGQMAFADVNSDMQSLGGNKDLIRRAKAIDPKNKVQVVQNRSVDRDWRLELGVNYGAVAGGDPYVSTNNLGAQIDLHITPHWSVGARYYSSGNALSSEGERVFREAQAARAGGVDQARPEIDYVSDTYLGVLNWYPIYGKLNLFDISIAQFDIYLLGGGGQVKLTSGMAPTWTAGGGVGFWLSQHFATHFEVRYQTYEDQMASGSRKLDLTILTATLGFLL